MTERYFHANAEALRNAVGALPAIGALSADEREAFKKWLAEQG